MQRYRAGVATGLAEMELVSVKAGRVFSPTQWKNFTKGYLVYRSACMHLCADCIARKVLRWRQRPKSHQLEHLCFDWKGLNPRYMANYNDEDFIRRAKKQALASNPRFVAKHVLFRYTVDSALRWTDMGLW